MDKTIGGNIFTTRTQIRNTTFSLKGNLYLRRAYEARNASTSEKKVEVKATNKLLNRFLKNPLLITLKKFSNDITDGNKLGTGDIFSRGVFRAVMSIQYNGKRTRNSTTAINSQKIKPLRPITDPVISFPPS